MGGKGHLVATTGSVQVSLCEWRMNYCERRYFRMYQFLPIHENGNFACIKIRALSMIGSLGYFENNFSGVHIFPGNYYTKKHRGGCTRGSLRPGHLITNRTLSVRLVMRARAAVMTPEYRL